jgi:hypothetical protein
MASTVLGLARDDATAREIVARMITGHFPMTDVSILRSSELSPAPRIDAAAAEQAPDPNPDSDDQDNRLAAPHPHAGAVPGFGFRSIPGLPPFVAAGPAVGSLEALASVAAVDGLPGVLMGLGVPGIDAHRYAVRLEQGHVLISLYVHLDEDLLSAKECFALSGATCAMVASIRYLPTARAVSRRLALELGRRPSELGTRRLQAALENDAIDEPYSSADVWVLTRLSPASKSWRSGSLIGPR